MVQTLQGTSLEARVAHLQELQKQAPDETNAAFHQQLEMLWIYHDSAIEGVVYTQDELRSAILEQVMSDSSLIPVYDEIRHHQAAIHRIRELAQKKRLTVDLDLIKSLFATLAPEELEGKAPRYRKDMPLHRLYFHEISQPEKIASQMRQLAQWMNAPETKRSTHAVRLAARSHYQLIHTYPFAKHSGKVARLVLNLQLLHAGYPPVIVHATERQRYYEALKQGEDKTAKLISEALVGSVESTIAFYER